jgi:3-oxoadipate CoA-transferase beta subunit
MSARLNRRQIAWCAAQDIPDGTCVNLGIGLPTLVADYLPPDREILLHSENGILGMGPKPAPDAIDPALINASKEYVTLLPGASICHHNDSFLMIRGGHIDLVMLGAFQVSVRGDLANWSIDDKRMPPAVGGAMDLAVGAKSVWVLMDLTTKDGTSRLVRECSYPLTASACVRRVYTDYGTIALDGGTPRIIALPEGIAAAELSRLSGLDLVQDPACRIVTPPA